MNIGKLRKIFQDTHARKKIVKTAKLIYIIFILILILGMFNFLKSTEKETVLLLG